MDAKGAAVSTKLGSSISASSLLDIMQRGSTKVHSLVYELLSLDSQLKQLSDQDLETAFSAEGSEDPIGDRISFRAWQASMKGFADNYTGQGDLTDKSTEIIKRVRPTF